MERELPMKIKLGIFAAGAVLLALLAPVGGQEPNFPVISAIDADSIAGRPVQLDDKGKLLPWPMPNNTGYSYSSYVLSQWTILWDH